MTAALQDPLHYTDAERAANAMVSLRNDEIMRHLSAHFHDQFSTPGRDTPSRPAAGLLNTNTPGARLARQETDPFDTVPRQPIPVYRDGAEYERDAMQDGRGSLAD